MPTMDDLVEKTRSKVRGSMPEKLNVLAEPYEAASGSVKLQVQNSGATPGTLVSVGLNTFFVTAASADGTQLTVLPSADGGPDQDLPALTKTIVKPQSTTWAIFRELHDEIVAMSSPRSGIYQPVAFESYVNWASGVYELPEDWQEDAIQPMKLLRVRYKDQAYDRWYPVENAEWLPERWNVQLATFPEVATLLEFTFAFPFRPPQSLQDDVTLLGLTEKTTQDIPTLGAAAALFGAGEGRRVQPSAQGDSRRSEEVPVGSSSSLSQLWMKQRRERIAEEKTRLNNLFSYTRAMGMGV